VTLRPASAIVNGAAGCACGPVSTNGMSRHACLAISLAVRLQLSASLDPVERRRELFYLGHPLRRIIAMLPALGEPGVMASSARGR
jgi:hypothetical protein